MRGSRISILILLILPIINAYSITSLNNFLYNYSISSTTIKSLTIVNLTYGSSNYAALYNGKNLYLFVNVTKNLSLVTNTTTILNAIKPYAVTQALKSVNVTLLSNQMHKYQNSTSIPLNDCLYSTGISFQPGASCTISNYCASCKVIPICNKVLYKTGGPTGVFGLGIVKFNGLYNNLTSNYSIFYSSTASINSTNANTNIAKIVNSFSNISSITKSLPQNPIFPPPQNVDYSKCNTVGGSTTNTSLSGGVPWYCNAVGFCEFLTYNYTLLANMQPSINQLSGLSISNAQLAQLAQSAANNANNILQPLVYKKQTTQLNVILNTTLAKYNMSVANANSLLMHITNASLSASFNTLVQNYSYVKSNYINLNLTKYNITLKTQLTGLINLYNRANGTYNSITILAKNNTQLILNLELTASSPSTQLTALGFKEAQLNSQLSGKPSNLSGIKSQLNNVHTAALALTFASGANPLVELTRIIDGQIVTAILAPMNLPYSSSVALVPLLSALISLIIGLVILAILLLKYRSLASSKRLKANPRTKRNWSRLFLVAGILIIAYVLLTYLLASVANASAPINAYKSQLQNSKSVAILQNGTVTNAMQYCVSQIETNLKNSHKTFVVGGVSGNGCTVNGTVYSTDTCLNSYASKNVPVIMLQNGTSSSIGIYSFYGSIIRAKGDNNFMNSCVLSAVLR